MGAVDVPVSGEGASTAWDRLPRGEAERYVEGYMGFLDEARTEREVVEYLVGMARERGFRELAAGEELSPGDRVYMTFRGKTAVFAVVGEEPPSRGVRLVAAHGDAPRFDPKPRPLGESRDAWLAYLSVGYYGGVVPYQWVSVPLELRGVVVRGDGSVVRVRIGGLVAPDLLPHLSRRRFSERKGVEVVRGEEVKVLLANRPVGGGWKRAVLRLLEERYGLSEDDLVTADLEVVPAYKPFSAGLDGSLVAGYGQDDRVCVYTGFTGLLDAEPRVTSVFWVVDKEEIGSETNTSAQSEFFRYFMARLLEATGGYSELALREALLSTKAVSADVGAGINPGFGGYYDKENFARLGGGVVFEKYLSAAGKGGANEARAEYAGWVRRVLDDAGVPWQAALLVSRADPGLGGGGTISKFMARLGMDVIDLGVALLGMHSPLEISSKADVYSAYLGYKAFYEAP